MYNYEEQKPALFTDQGQKLFLAIRDRTQKLLAQSGAVRLQEIISNSSGDSWLMLACVDRMVELNELRELPTSGASQHRVFVGTNR